MRAIPTALAVTDGRRRADESMEVSAITHDDPRCTVACAAYNEVAAALLEDDPPHHAVDRGHRLAQRLGGAVVADAYGRQLRPQMLAVTGQTFLADDAAGFVLDSLSLAVAAVLDPRPLPEVLVDIVRIGNDTDTNAAIAGGLLGVRDGAAAIPTRWRSVLQYADEFTNAAERLIPRSAAQGG
jgi:ADP-ribosylglycohydrolase